MVSSPGDQIDGSTPASGSSKSNWLTQIDTEQVFRLIDSILPFEACLYHQVLPLSLNGSRLKLGMVNLEDTAAIDYVRRILAFMNCSLVPQTLASNAHHAVLTAYLNYVERREHPTGRFSPAERPSSTPTNQATDALHPPDAHPELPDSPDSTDRPSDAKQPFAQPVVADAQVKPTEPTASSTKATLSESVLAPTLLVHSPEALTVLHPPAGASNRSGATVGTNDSDDATPETTNNRSSNPRHLQPTLILESHIPPPPELPLDVPGSGLPVLTVNARHLSAPVDVLRTLPADRLLEELLGRILIGGIGRLYFERQPQAGRILWSQNGVLQSVLEALPLAIFQGVLQTLKQLTHLSIEPVQQAQQVEIERLYQRQRLLLRLRIMPGKHGEEATLQVLRGAALKFYQQQQLANLSRAALTVAQDLQHKVNELRIRSRTYSSLSPEQVGILPEIGEVIKGVEQQLQALQAMQMEFGGQEPGASSQTE